MNILLIVLVVIGVSFVASVLIGHFLFHAFTERDSFVIRNTGTEDMVITLEDKTQITVRPGEVSPLLTMSEQGRYRLAFKQKPGSGNGK